MAKKNVVSVVDTNILIRFFIADIKSQSIQVKGWFTQAAQNRRELVILPVVVAECCYVLEKVYKVERNKLASAFEILISQRWLNVVDRDILLDLWDGYRNGLHFVDSFLVSYGRIQESDILSFDKRLLKKAK